jgi:hypothetical protein
MAFLARLKATKGSSSDGKYAAVTTSDAAAFTIGDEDVDDADVEKMTMCAPAPALL